MDTWNLAICEKSFSTYLQYLVPRAYTMTESDYIIIGAGAAGLMFADAMGKDPFFASKTILLLDKDPKQTNDRTWCFWEKGAGEFEEMLSATWDHIYVSDSGHLKRMSIAPYRYKMVRGSDFYKSRLSRISGYANISFTKDTVSGLSEASDGVVVSGVIGNYRANQVFNSIFDYSVISGQKKYPVLQQHFVGWFIRTDQPSFTADTVTFMDFTLPQLGNTRFMYILPVSETEALVEYTLFSATPLARREYEEAIEAYLKDHPCIAGFKVIEKESGNIPMSCFDLSGRNTSRVLYIGTAGGWTKPSTGYTFKNTSRNITKLLHHLKVGKPLHSFSVKNRFWYYDLLLLDILFGHNETGKEIFESMYRKLRPQLIFKFLDEQTNLLEDLRVIMACPKRKFLKAFLSRIGRYFKG